MGVSVYKMENPTSSSDEARNQHVQQLMYSSALNGALQTHIATKTKIHGLFKYMKTPAQEALSAYQQQPVAPISKEGLSTSQASGVNASEASTLPAVGGARSLQKGKSSQVRTSLGSRSAGSFCVALPVRAPVVNPDEGEGGAGDDDDASNSEPELEPDSGPESPPPIPSLTQQLLGGLDLDGPSPRVSGTGSFQLVQGCSAGPDLDASMPPGRRSLAGSLAGSFKKSDPTWRDPPPCANSLLTRLNGRFHGASLSGSSFFDGEQIPGGSDNLLTPPFRRSLPGNALNTPSQSSKRPSINPSQAGSKQTSAEQPTVPASAPTPALPVASAVTKASLPGTAGRSNSTALSLLSSLNRPRLGRQSLAGGSSGQEIGDPPALSRSSTEQMVVAADEEQKPVRPASRLNKGIHLRDKGAPRMSDPGAGALMYVPPAPKALQGGGSRFMQGGKPGGSSKEESLDDVFKQGSKVLLASYVKSELPNTVEEAAMQQPGAVVFGFSTAGGCSSTGTYVYAKREKVVAMGLVKGHRHK